MPRFVVLYHETPPDYPRASHYDLMFERDGALWTFALPRLPAKGVAVDAEQLADHRLTYLDYEGEVSAGRGSVRRVDAGEYARQETGDRGQKSGRIVLDVRGTLLQGMITLSPITAGDGLQRWRVELGSA